MFSLHMALWLSAACCVSAFNTTSKRGVAFSAADTPGDLVNTNQTKSQTSWVYDWGNSPADYLVESHLEYIPMQWGSGAIDVFQTAVIKQGVKAILAFNEPDYNNESNLDPEQAAQLWKDHIEPLKALGIRLGGPAVTASSTGKPWLEAFFAACNTCTIDFLPLHWYGDGVSGFYDYLWSIHGLYPRLPIWVTEFASTSPNQTEVAQFLNASITYMDGLDWIERYAWFGYFRPKADQIYNLLDDKGALNELGHIYTGVKTIHTQTITQPPNKPYQTANGADNPTQGLVTTYAAFAGANRAPRHWDILGGETARYQFLILCTAVFAGTVWIL